MTKIKNYALDTNISGGDKWIGSDANSLNRTKNFSVAGISDYYNSSASINQANSLLFFYDTVGLGESRSAGSFSFETEVGPKVSFDSITNLLFSKSSKNGPDVVDFMESMIGGTLLFQKAGNSNFFSYYKLDSFEQNISEPNFYNAVLQHISSNGDIEEDSDYFITLVQPFENKVNFYTHTQNVASATWYVNHNLNKYPSVTVTLPTGQVGVADVTYTDTNNLIITFAGDESGKAYIN